MQMIIVDTNILLSYLLEDNKKFALLKGKWCGFFWYVKYLVIGLFLFFDKILTKNQHKSYYTI